MWLTNSRWRELHVHDQDLWELCNEEGFYTLFSLLFPINHHLLINFHKRWNDFPFPEIRLTAHKIVFNQGLLKHFLHGLDSDFECSCLICPRCHLKVSLIFFNFGYHCCTVIMGAIEFIKGCNKSGVVSVHCHVLSPIRLIVSPSQNP